MGTSQGVTVGMCEKHRVGRGPLARCRCSDDDLGELPCWDSPWHRLLPTGAVALAMLPTYARGCLSVAHEGPRVGIRTGLANDASTNRSTGPRPWATMCICGTGQIMLPEGAPCKEISAGSERRLLSCKRHHSRLCSVPSTNISCLDPKCCTQGRA